MYDRLIVLFFAFLVILSTSCSDQGALNADENFASGGLQTIYVDTFSVITSTVFTDSLPTSSRGTLLIGGYKDDFLGLINSSSNFQVGYTTVFPPTNLLGDILYDSIGLILPYNKSYYGDTTQTMTIEVSQLTERINQRSLPPYAATDKISILNPTYALYNTSKVSYASTPLASKKFAPTPSQDSLFIRLSDALGRKFYDVQNNIPDVIKYQSASNASVIPSWFIETYFKGVHISVPSTTDASIIGFSTAKAKIRLFYRSKTQQDGELKNLYTDFLFTNPYNQFNQISADRSDTPIASIATSRVLPSESTGNASFIQSGIGLYTKVEFPTLKTYLKKNKIVVLDALLDVPLVANTYGAATPPMNLLACYTTDVSNIISGGVPGNGNDVLKASIRYDREYAINTKYSFSLTSYLNAEIKSNLEKITPLALASPDLFSEVKRSVIGNRFHPNNKIKLKIYYTQYGTN